MRSIMYPILGIVLSIVFFAFGVTPVRALAKDFSGMIVLVLSATQFLLMFFALLTPAVHFALMYMFAASIQVYAAGKATKGFWRLVDRFIMISDV